MNNRHDETVDADTLRQLQEIFSFVDKWVERTRNQSASVQSGSSLAADDAKTQPFQMSHAAAMAMASAVDHIETVQTTVVSARRVHTWSTLTILQSALENAALVVWILSPLSRAERILRLLQFQRNNFKDRDDILGLVPGQPRTLQQDTDRLETIGRSSGLTPDQLSRIKNMPKLSNIVSMADNAAPSFNGNGMAKLGWQCCSGVAHARPWATLSLLEHTIINTKSSDVLGMQVTLPDSNLLVMSQVAALMIHDGWYFLDRQRKRSY